MGTSRPKDKNAIGTKWVCKKKINEDGQVIKTRKYLCARDTLKLKEMTMKRLSLSLPGQRL